VKSRREDRSKGSPKASTAPRARELTDHLLATLRRAADDILAGCDCSTWPPPNSQRTIIPGTWVEVGVKRSWGCSAGVAAALAIGSCGGSITSSDDDASGGAAGARNVDSGEVHAGGTGATGGSSGSSAVAGQSPCPAGSELCPCYGNGTCNAGLTCASDLCVALGTGGIGAATGSGATSGAGTSGTSGSGSSDGGMPGAGVGGVGGGDAGAPSAGVGGEAIAGAGGFSNAGTGSSGGQAEPCGAVVGLADCTDFETFAAERVPSNVLLMVDKSGSMAEIPDGYRMDKWSALRAALSSALQDARDGLSFGLEFFPSTASTTPIPRVCGDVDRCCEMPSGSDMNVDIGPGHQTVPEILTELSEAESAGGAPMAVALRRAVRYFETDVGADLVGDRFVVLVADGGPNCNPNLSCTLDECTLNIDEAEACPSDGISCCTNYPIACLDGEDAVDAAQDLAGLGVATIVVGLPGSEPYQSLLERLAVAGGYVRPDGGAGYFQVSAAGGAQELADTLALVLSELRRDCAVPIPGDIQNPNLVNVTADCEVIPRGDGATSWSHWQFDDDEQPSQFLLAGPICDSIRDEGVERLDVVYGCPTEQLD